MELVCVGELELDESGRALVAATTEAMVNAAKHAGVRSVSTSRWTMAG